MKVGVVRNGGLYVITTGGRIDSAVARAVIRLSLWTWARRTRWLPQNLVTVLALGYCVASLGWIWTAAEWRGWGAVNVVAVVFVCAVFERGASEMRGLSASPSFKDLERARRWAGIRPIVWILGGIALYAFAAGPGASSTFALVQWALYLATTYVLTMGRRNLPPKKERRRLGLRLPRLVPSGVRA